MGFTFNKEKADKEVLVCGTSNGNSFSFWIKSISLTQTEYAKLKEEFEQIGEKDPNGTAHGTIPFADHLMIEWVNKKDDPARWLVDNETGEPLDFTPEGKSKLLDEEGVAFAIVSCYELSRFDAEAIAGNYAASRKSGQGKTRPAARSEAKI